MNKRVGLLVILVFLVATFSFMISAELPNLINGNSNRPSLDSADISNKTFNVNITNNQITNNINNFDQSLNTTNSVQFNNLTLTGNISLEFGDLVSEQNPDLVNSFRIKVTNDFDIVLGGMTDYFSVWNSVDDTAVFFVDNDGNTDLLGDLNIGDDIFMSEDGLIGISASTERILFDGTGGFINLLGAKVGIGTSIPQKDLHIESGVPTLRLSDSNAGTDRAVATLIELYRGNNANRVGFLGMESSSNDILKFATDYVAGEIAFSTGSSSEAMRIDSSGSVGIGTSTPTAKLHINDITQIGLIVQGYNTFRSLTGTPSGEIKIGNHSSYYGTMSFDGNGHFDIINYADTVNSYINFIMRASGTPINVMSVRGTGRVGINTTNPSSSLDIVGDFEVSENAIFNRNVGIGVAVPNHELDMVGDFAVGGTDFYVDDFLGRVGIGTNNPQNELNIIGTGNFTGNLIIGSLASPQNLTMYSPNGSSFSCGVLNDGSWACS